MVAVKVGNVNFQYENLCFLKVTHSFDSLETQFKLVLDVLAQHENRFVAHEKRFDDDEKLIAKQGVQIKVLEEKVKAIDELAAHVKVLQKTAVEHDTRIKECEKVGAEFQRVVEQLKEHAGKWKKLSHHDFGGHLKAAGVEPTQDELDLFLGHLTFLSVDNSLIRAARPALEFMVGQGDFGGKYTKNVLTLEGATRDITKLQGETEQIHKDCEDFRVTFETHAGQIGALERGVVEVKEQSEKEVKRIDDAMAEDVSNLARLTKNVGELGGDLQELDKVAARTEDLGAVREIVTDVRDDVEKMQMVVNSYSQAKDALREELEDKMNALQKKIEVSLNEIKMKGGGGGGRGRSKEPGEVVRDVVHVQADLGNTNDLRKKIEAHTLELETLYDLYRDIEDSVNTKLDRKDLSSKTDVSQCEQLLLNIADQVDRQMEGLSFDSPANAELRETLRRLQDAVDGRVEAMPGASERRVSRRNVENSRPIINGTTPDAPYTQQPSIVRVRTMPGKGASNANLHIVKTRVTAPAVGSDGVLYHGMVQGSRATITPLQEGPRGDVRDRPSTAGVRGGKSMIKGSAVAPSKIYAMDPR